MTKRELKRLSRADLLEMLLELRKENDALQRQLETTRAQLESREITIMEAGSIAEAALRLSGIFEAAQAAADQYLESVRHLAESSLS